MIIALGADHAGFVIKGWVKSVIEAAGHTVEDCGSYDDTPCDYPDIAQKVCELVASGKAARGVVVCGSGVGACVAANKITGIRAGVCHDTYSARQGVEHDDMNVLCLGGRVIGVELAGELLRSFLSAQYSGEERHVRRLAKISALERQSREDC